jgi:hypothetical protein
MGAQDDGGQGQWTLLHPQAQARQQLGHRPGGLLLASISEASSRPGFGYYVPSFATHMHASSTVTTRAVPLAYIMLAPGIQASLPKALGGLSFGLHPHSKGSLHASFLPQLFSRVNHQIHREAGKIAAILGSTLLLKLSQLERGCQEIQAQQQQMLERHLRWRPWAAFRRRARRSDDGAALQTSTLSAAQQQAEQWCERGAQHERAFDLAAAAAAYEEALKLCPSSVAYLVKLAKVLSDHTYEQGIQPPQVGGQAAAGAAHARARERARACTCARCRANPRRRSRRRRRRWWRTTSARWRWRRPPSLPSRTLRGATSPAASARGAWRCSTRTTARACSWPSRRRTRRARRCSATAATTWRTT